MNTKGALSADSLTSLNNGGAVSTQAQPMQNMQPQMFQAQPMQNMQPQISQTQPMQNMQPQMSQAQYTQNMQPQMSQAQYTQNMQPQMSQTQPMATRQRPSGTGVHLKKGQKTSLSQMNPNLSEIQVCLGWDISNQACDLDASVFMLGDDNKVVGDDWFVFYGQPTSPDGSIIHRGDSYDGAEIGDDEIIDIKLNQINQMVKKIAFVITINEARERNLNFSMVSNAYVRVVDKLTGKELVKFMLTDYFSNVTSMVVGEVYNKGGQWRFNPVGNGFAEDLEGLCNVYGVNVAD
ncbi:MAG: TerD family protein [Acutalibacteraceae bacterium]|nr:TerD family protein [Acutalibacteraceae bacterium]